MSSERSGFAINYWIVVRSGLFLILLQSSLLWFGFAEYARHFAATDLSAEAKVSSIDALRLRNGI